MKKKIALLLSIVSLFWLFSCFKKDSETNSGSLSTGTISSWNISSWTTNSSTIEILETKEEKTESKDEVKNFEKVQENSQKDDFSAVNNKNIKKIENKKIESKIEEKTEIKNEKDVEKASADIEKNLNKLLNELDLNTSSLD